MENEKRMRSKLVGKYELDNEMLKIHDEGGVVYQVLPCPKAIDQKFISCEDLKQIPTSDFVMDMEFMVLYVEEVKD